MNILVSKKQFQILQLCTFKKLFLKKEYEIADIHYSLHLTYLTLLLVQLWRETTMLYVA